MSRRSILLATTLCMALVSTAATNPASARSGGGGFGGGSFHSAGSGSFSHGAEFAPAHTGTMTSPAFAVSKTVTTPFRLATHHILKAGNGAKPTPKPFTTGQVPAPIYTGSIDLRAKGPKIPPSACPPVDPSPNLPIGPAPAVLPDPTVPY